MELPRNFFKTFVYAELYFQPHSAVALKPDHVDIYQNRQRSPGNIELLAQFDEPKFARSSLPRRCLPRFRILVFRVNYLQKTAMLSQDFMALSLLISLEDNKFLEFHIKQAIIYNF